MISELLRRGRKVVFLGTPFWIFISPLSAQSHVVRVGTVVDETVHSSALVGNLLGDSPDRSVTVYLPPGYQGKSSRYPVIYLLHGFLANNKSWTESDWAHVPKTMDALIAAGKIRSMIVVMPDGSNKLGGSFYTNSVTTGNWEDFITRDLVKYIDTKYRTVPHATSRGIAGHSMGGYGAIKIAIKHPEIFGAVYALSACCMEWGGGMSPSNPAWNKTMTFRSLSDVAAARDYISRSEFNFQDPEVSREFVALAALSMSAAWSPDPARPPFFADFLVEGSGDARTISAMHVAQWSANMPIAMFGQYRSNLKKLVAIAFDVGKQDESPEIPAAAHDFDAGLTSNGIRHQFDEYDGTHNSRIAERLESRVFPFFSLALK